MTNCMLSVKSAANIQSVCYVGALKLQQINNISI